MCIGNVPESLFDLTELTELILNSIEDFNDKSYDNVFSGILPRDIQKLVKLRKLSFKNNELTGTIPDSLCNLTQIQEIYLSNNGLSGSLPDNSFKIFNAENLGNIPENIGNLASIKILHLQKNKLTGCIPESIGKLKTLADFRLKDNDITDGCHNLYMLKELKISNIIVLPPSYEECLPKSLRYLLNADRLPIWIEKFPFHSACWTGDRKKVENEIRNNARDYSPLSTVDEYGLTPFYYSLHNNSGISSYMLIAGFSPFSSSKYLFTPPWKAWDTSRHLDTILHKLLRQRPSVEALEKYLSFAPNSIGCQNGLKQLPVEVAISSKCSWNVVALLLEGFPLPESKIKNKILLLGGSDIKLGFSTNFIKKAKPIPEYDSTLLPYSQLSSKKESGKSQDDESRFSLAIPAPVNKRLSRPSRPSPKSPTKIVRSDSNQSTDPNQDFLFLIKAFKNDMTKLSDLSLHICGNGSSGKSTLVNSFKKYLKIKIEHPYVDPIPPSKRTVGLDIHLVESRSMQFSLFGRKKELLLTIYDYGGQKEYHVNHAKFMAVPNSIFIIVLAYHRINGTGNFEEFTPSQIEDEYNYWLKFIYSVADHSRPATVITIINKMKNKEVTTSVIEDVAKRIESIQNVRTEVLHSGRDDRVLHGLTFPKTLTVDIKEEVTRLNDQLYPLLKNSLQDLGINPVPDSHYIRILKSSLKDLSPILPLDEFRQYIKSALMTSLNIKNPKHKFIDFLVYLGEKRLIRNGVILSLHKEDLFPTKSQDNMETNWIVTNPNFLSTEIFGKIAHYSRSTAGNANSNQSLFTEYEVKTKIFGHTDQSNQSIYDWVPETNNNDVLARLAVNRKVTMKMILNVLVATGSCIEIADEDGKPLYCFPLLSCRSINENNRTLDIYEKNRGGRVILRLYKLLDPTRSFFPKGYFESLYADIAHIFQIHPDSIKIFSDGMILKPTANEGGFTVDMEIKVKKMDEGFTVEVRSKRTDTNSRRITPSAAWEAIMKISALVIKSDHEDFGGFRSNIFRLNLGLEEYGIHPETNETREMTRLIKALKDGPCDECWYIYGGCEIKSTYYNEKALLPDVKEVPNLLSPNGDEVIDQVATQWMCNYISPLLLKQNNELNSLKNLMITVLHESHDIPTTAVILPSKFKAFDPRKLFLNRYSLYFVCAHTFNIVPLNEKGDGYEFSEIKSIVMKLKPLLICGFAALKLCAMSSGIPIPLPEFKSIMNLGADRKSEAIDDLLKDIGLSPVDVKRFIDEGGHQKIKSNGFPDEQDDLRFGSKKQARDVLNEFLKHHDPSRNKLNKVMVKFISTRRGISCWVKKDEEVLKVLRENDSRVCSIRIS